MANATRTGCLLKGLLVVAVCCARLAAAQDLKLCWELTVDTGSSSSNNLAYGVGANQADDIIVSGVVTDALEGFTNPGGMDLFVMQVSSSGTRNWTQQIGSDDTLLGEHPGKSALSEAGETYALVETPGSFGDIPNRGSTDIAVLKLSADGLLQWVYQMGTPHMERAGDIAVTQAGEIVICGSTFGNLEDLTDSGSLSPSTFFVAKILANGTHAWTSQVENPSQSSAFAERIDVSDAGEIFVAFATFADFDSNGRWSQRVVYVFMFSKDGTAGWRELIRPASGSLTLGGLALDQNADLLLGGTVSGHFAGYESISGRGIYVTKVLSNGTRTWTLQMSVGGRLGMTALKIDADGDVIVAGTTPTAWPGFTQVSSSDLYLVKVLADGTLNWTFQIGWEWESGSMYPWAFAIDNSGAFLVAGQWFRRPDNLFDIYVAKASTDCPATSSSSSSTSPLSRSSSTSTSSSPSSQSSKSTSSSTSTSGSSSTTTSVSSRSSRSSSSSTSTSASSQRSKSTSSSTSTTGSSSATTSTSSSTSSLTSTSGSSMSSYSSSTTTSASSKSSESSSSSTSTSGSSTSSHSSSTSTMSSRSTSSTTSSSSSTTTSSTTPSLNFTNLTMINLSSDEPFVSAASTKVSAARRVGGVVLLIFVFLRQLLP